MRLISHAKESLIARNKIKYRAFAKEMHQTGLIVVKCVSAIVKCASGWSIPGGLKKVSAPGGRAGVREVCTAEAVSLAPCSTKMRRNFNIPRR